MKISLLIDKLYKQATITVPSKDEAKKENIPSDRNLPTIKCEVCEYEGKTTERGECPECGAIGGVKPTIKAPGDAHRNQQYTGEPQDGLSVYELDDLGRLDEV